MTDSAKKRPLKRRVKPQRRNIPARDSAAPRKSLLVPITNAYGNGDYTAAIRVGSQGAVANVILDTGSSTLAVKRSKYQPTHDTQLKVTDLAQVVLYGTGGWAGPVVQTGVTIGEGDSQAVLPGVSLAIATVQQPDNFGIADGILGLAYSALNGGYALGNPTYPWTFHVEGTHDALVAFDRQLSDKTHNQQTAVTPYFDALDQQGVVANKFAFYTLRSWPQVSSDNETPATLAQNPLNQGFVVLGGGEEQTQLYRGSTFTEVTVSDDIYYNVNLVSVQVGTGPVVNAKPIQAELVAQAGSNAIVDTGTNSLALADDVYRAVLTGLKAVDPHFPVLVEESTTTDGHMKPTPGLDLSKWPDLHFAFTGPSGPVTLTVTPQTYWQADAAGPGKFLSALGSLGDAQGTSNQSIFGLPLMSNYYTVFDRSDGKNGVIKFAPIQYPPAQRVVDDRVQQRFAARKPEPVITNKPSLPLVSFEALGKQAPIVPANPAAIPQADTIVICWAEAEWAPLHHVFVAGNQEMPYSDKTAGTWAGWQKFSDGAPSHVGYWGLYRLVEINGKKVLLFKSEAHLSEGPSSGTSYVAQMMSALIAKVQPKLVLSTGTAGGTRLTDHVGTVNIVNSGTLYQAGVPSTKWQHYGSDWKPNTAILNDPKFKTLLFPIPTTAADLQSLADQFNTAEGTSYALNELNPQNLNGGDPVPAVNDLTPNVSLLTANSFVVADTSGNYANFACVEMDDAALAQVCSEKHVPFGSIRNISDAAQNASLPDKVGGSWGSFIYEAYGFYSSYANALVAWAVLAA